MPSTVLALLRTETPLLRRIAEETSVAIALIVPPLWRFVYANAAYEKFSANPIVGRTLAEVFPGMAQNGIDLLDAPLKTGVTFSRRAFPVRLRESEAETWWDFDHIPLPGADGSPAAVLIIAREVSDHVGALKEAERARTALQANEERLRLAMDAGRMFCWDFDLNSQAVTWSYGLATAMGMPEGSFDGTLNAFRALVHPDDLARVDADIASAVTGDKPYDIQFRMIRADGSVRWVASKANVLRDKYGHPARMVGIDLDITKEKVAETALRDSEATLRSLVETAPVGLGIVDRDLRLRYANARLLEINGVPADAPIGMPLRELVGEFADRLEPIHQQVLDTGEAIESVALSGELPNRPGEKRRWVASYFPVSNNAGETVGVKKVVMDVTAECNAAEDADAARQLVRSVIDSIPDSVTVRDREGRYIFANAATFARLGDDRPLTDIIGRTSEALLPAPLAEAAHQHVLAVLRDQQSVTTEEVFEHAGETRHFHTIRTPWRAKDQTILGVVTVARDVTERRRAEQLTAAVNVELERKVADRTAALVRTVQELRQEIEQRTAAQAELIRAQKLEALGQLTSGIAHDFNNVLTAISGSLELLERRLTDERLLKLLQNGQHATRRAAGLISRLMAHSRQRPSEPQVLNVSSLLQETKALLDDTLGSFVHLRLEPATDLWHVVADPSALQSALINLCVNGRDAMPGGGLLRIVARNLPTSIGQPLQGANGVTLPPGDYVAIAVIDTGAGMSQDVLDKVLEPFFTTKGPGRGTGLGLSMVQRFVQESRGILRLESEVGTGTKAEIILPRTDIMASAEEGPNDVIDLTLHGGATIMVVEDDHLLRAVLTGFLRDYGYTVLEANSVAAGYAVALAAPRVDMVVCDVVMPDSHGLDLARRLRESRPNLPFLFVTGFDDPVLPLNELVLRKPFSLQVLGDAILRTLRRVRPVGEGDPAVSRVAQRMSSVLLRSIYLAWHDLKAKDGMPRLADLSLDAPEIKERSFVAECLDDSTLRYVRVGARLSVRASKVIEGTTVQATIDPAADESGLGAIEAAYARCRRTRLPNYEYARYDLGDGQPAVFERLLLPLSKDGVDVTHIAGVVLMSEPPLSTVPTG